MRAGVVIEVLPLEELLVEEPSVVDDDPVQEPVEFLCIDAVRAFDLPVETRSHRFDVDVPDALVEHVVVECRLELRAVEFPMDVKSSRAT